MLTRRAFLQATGILMAGSALAACAPKATPEPTTAPSQPKATQAPAKATEAPKPTATPPPKKEAVTIRLMAWGNPTEVKAREATIGLFEETHPDIKVNFIHVPQGYGDKLQTMLAGGDYPDVFFLGNGDILSYATRKQLLDLNPLIERDNVDTSDIFPANLALYNVDGTQYGFPVDAPNQQLFFNKTRFEEKGVPLPSPDWEDRSFNWDAFLDAAKALTNEDENQYGFQVRNGNFRQYWLFITANGGEMFNEDGTKCLLNEPPAVEALQFLADLINVHKVAPPMDVAAEMGAAELFQSGITAMETWWPAIGRMRTNIKDFEWDVAPHPAGKAGKTCTGGGTGHVMSSHAPNVDQGWEFMKFVISKPCVEKWTEIMGIVPPLKSVAESPVFKRPDAPPEHITVFTDGNAYLRPDPRHIKFPQARQIMTSELEYLWTGERDAQTVCDSIAKQIDELIQGD